MFPIDDSLVPDDQLDFELIVRQAEREFMGSSERRQSETPFYHYCRAGGLEGILQSEGIWATDYRKLNDKRELTIGEEAVQAELDAVIRENSYNCARGFICRCIEERRQGNRLIDIADVYVASFSRDGDLLSQWATYTDRYAGYSLGFRSVPLPTKAEAAADLDSALAVDCRPCLYQEAEFRALVRKALFHMADGYEKYVETYGDGSLEREGPIRDQAVSSALAQVGALIPFYKHSGFIDEREWRLYYIGEPPVRLTRPGPHGETPYIEVPLKKPDRMDLYEVITGPKATEADVAFARETLDRCGYGHVPVNPSRVPYH